MTNERINKEALLEEIECALTDCFVAKTVKEEDCIILQFENGQKFRLHLQETK